MFPSALFVFVSAVMALAVTEPQAGSDVANLTTTARRDGDFFVLDGVKKFISAGMKADWFVVACRTGGEGMGGVSLLLVDANSEGIRKTRQSKSSWEHIELVCAGKCSLCALQVSHSLLLCCLILVSMFGAN